MLLQSRHICSGKRAKVNVVLSATGGLNKSRTVSWETAFQGHKKIARKESFNKVMEGLVRGFFFEKILSNCFPTVS